jgi:DNA/RNA endonuclease G (NUC1)
VLYNGSNGLAYDTRALSGTIPDQCNGRGTISITYASNGIQNGSPDGLALINATGGVEEFLSYEGTMTALGPPATGAISSDIIVSQSGSDPIGESLQRDALGKWHSPRTSSFGACNVIVTTPVNPITFTGRTLGDPALPVGFQDQLFATLRDPSGNVVSTTFTWLSETPAIATIDQNGVMTAVGAGQAIIRATAVTGATSTVTLPTRIATASATAQYGFNTEFGVPADADNSDDFLVTYPQFTTSFNKNRGTPNWVSYNLDATHFGPEDRCDCFTFDPNLPGEFQRYTTADYTGAGTFHGYGIDRGHFARSFDRTAGSLDNAHTYYFTNIVPQAADNNQGPWAAMENALGDLARFSDKELFIIAGVAGSKGTVKDEGKIVIPAKVWKVALILPRDQGLASVDDPSDVQVVAVIMPNDPGIRNVNWETYKTTVDAVEALSGYDVFALLPNPIETAVESGTSAPTAATDGPYTGLEGSSLPMSGAGSSDPDVGQTLIYSWDFGDGSTGTGATTSHTFTQDGSYTVTLTVTDPLGLSSVATATATVFNVTPSIAAFAGATLLPGETYAASGSFTDPGSDSWSATVDYGDGSGQSALSLNGKSFSLSHTYGAAGTFTVTVNVSDDDATSTGTQTVVVLSASQAVSQLRGMVNQLLQGDLITPGVATSLDTKLRNALKSLERGNTAEAITQLTEFLTELNSLVSSRRLTSAQADPLRILVQRVLQSIGG